MTNEGDDQLERLITQLVQTQGWTPTMVLWNTVGTVAGALVGIVALVIALIALTR